MHIAVVGAGAVGLCTAWYLKDCGAEVTVFDLAKPGNGASWGNAGQILPSKAVPLSEPGNLKFALKSLLRKNSPITAPRTFDIHMLNFFRHFILNSSPDRHNKGSESMLTLGKSAFTEFENMEKKGVRTTRVKAPFTAAFTKNSESLHMSGELAGVEKILGRLHLEVLSQEELLRREPLLSDRFTHGLQLNDQYFLNPPLFLKNLEESLNLLGVRIENDTQIEKIKGLSDHVELENINRKKLKFDYVIIATGAWLNNLTHEFGIKHPVVAGIGYSLAVDVPFQTQGMLYFPDARVATTNYGDRLRVSSFMQMARAGTPLSSTRTARLLALAQNEIPSAKWSTANEFWSGGRPLSGDGKPLIGKTNHPRVYVNSGHGMWGITLAPASAKLISDSIMNKGAIAKDFDPLR